MKDATPVDSEEYEFALREVQLLQMLQHDNVVQLLEAYQSTSGRLYLVFEYVDQTLLGLLKSSHTGRGLPYPQIKSIMWQLLQALSFMHRKKVIHRDIKPSNVLVSASGIVKLCDFGFARPLEHDQAVADYTTYVVTRWYRAPEVLIGDAYGPAVDIWSFGCIFAELFTGRALFPGRNNNDQLWLVLTAIGRLCEQHMNILKTDSKFASFRVPLPHEYVKLESRLQHVPMDVIQLLKACLHPDPSKRLTADQLLRLPYFYDVESVLPREYLDSIATRDAAAEDLPAAEPEAARPAQEPVATAPLQNLQQQQQELQQQQQQLQLQQQELRHKQQEQQQQQQELAATRTRAAIAAATAAVAAAAETVVLGFPERPQDRRQGSGPGFAGRQDPPQQPAGGARSVPVHRSPERPLSSMPAAGSLPEPEPFERSSCPATNGYHRPLSGSTTHPAETERKAPHAEADAAPATVAAPWLQDAQVPKYLTNGDLMGKLEASGTLRRSVTAPEEELQLTTAMLLGTIGSRGSGMYVDPSTGGASFNQRISEPTVAAGAKPLPHRASETNVPRPGPRQQLQPKSSAPGVGAGPGASRGLLQPAGSQPLVPLTGNYTVSEEPSTFQMHKGTYGQHAGGLAVQGRGQGLAMSPSSSSASQLSLDDLFPSDATPPLQYASMPLRPRVGSAAPRSRRSSSDCGMLQAAASVPASNGAAAAAQQPGVLTLPATPTKHHHSMVNDGRRQSDSATGLGPSSHQSGGQGGALASGGSSGSGAAMTAPSAAAPAASAAAAAAAQMGGRPRFRKAQSIDGQCLFPGNGKADPPGRAPPPANLGTPADAPPAFMPPPPGAPIGAGATAAALPPLHMFALVPGAAAAAAAAAGSSVAAAAPLVGPPLAAGAPLALLTPASSAAEHGVKPSGGRTGVAVLPGEHLPVIRGTLLGAGIGGAGAGAGAPGSVARSAAAAASASKAPGAAPQPRASPHSQPPPQQQQQAMVNASPFFTKQYLPTLSRATQPQLAPLQSQSAKVEQQSSVRKKQVLMQAARKV